MNRPTQPAPASSPASSSLSSAGGILGIESMGPIWNGTVRKLANAIQDQMQSVRVPLGGMASPVMMPPSAGSGPTLSPDGNFWWNGIAWIASSQAAHPGPLLSPDSKAWYDGEKWHALSTEQSLSAP